MERRDFLKVMQLSGVGLFTGSLISDLGMRFLRAADVKRKYWTWVTTNLHATDDDWKQRFAVLRKAGIDAILPEVYDSRAAFYQSAHLPVKELWLERILPLAKDEGLEVHAWMWSMPCNIEDVRNQHPDWFVVNRNGESAAEKPAYVPTYKFLCPSHPGAREFVRTTVAELSQYKDLDGIHLDYIRFPDVILPEALWAKYNITQDREYPQYDYCYCDLCCADFERESGIDIRKVEDPTTNVAWRQFRYDKITHLVNDMLIPTAHEQKKQMTAAVFPNWQYVRQQWPVWKLDAALPMLYHTLYGEDTDWVRVQTERAVKETSGRFPIYSGLMAARVSAEEVGKAVTAALDGGASGVCIFPERAMNQEKLDVFNGAIKD